MQTVAANCGMKQLKLQIDITKGTYGYLNEQLFPKRWSLINFNQTKYHLETHTI